MNSSHIGVLHNPFPAECSRAKEDTVCAGSDDPEEHMNVFFSVVKINLQKNKILVFYPINIPSVINRK